MSQKRAMGVLGLVFYGIGTHALLQYPSEYRGDMPTSVLDWMVGLSFLWQFLSFLTLVLYVMGERNTRPLSFVCSFLWAIVFVSTTIDAITGPYVTVDASTSQLLEGCFLVFLVPGIIGLDTFDDIFSNKNV